MTLLRTFNIIFVFIFISTVKGLQIKPHQRQELSEIVGNDTKVTSCPTCLLVKTSSNIENVFPWLFNNPKAQFFYSHTDGDGYPIYQHITAQNNVYYIHFYDEGFFYDGFYVINDLESEYIEADGRVFIYNSDSDDCPDDTGRNWYFWSNGDWKWDDSIYMNDCNQ